MLESTCTRLDYINYDIFVGTYPNDEPTQMEVARAAFDRPRIHRVVCPNDGPTSKADCLNWIVEAIKLKEQETGQAVRHLHAAGCGGCRPSADAEGLQSLRAGV